MFVLFFFFCASRCALYAFNLRIGFLVLRVALCVLMFSALCFLFCVLRVIVYVLRFMFCALSFGILRVSFYVLRFVFIFLRPASCATLYVLMLFACCVPRFSFMLLSVLRLTAHAFLGCALCFSCIFTFRAALPLLFSRAPCHHSPRPLRTFSGFSAGPVCA